jgi:hypothetical protein
MVADFSHMVSLSRHDEHGVLYPFTFLKSGGGVPQQTSGSYLLGSVDALAREITGVSHPLPASVSIILSIRFCRACGFWPCVSDGIISYTRGWLVLLLSVRNIFSAALFVASEGLNKESHLESPSWKGLRRMPPNTAIEFGNRDFL